jgi:meso-butanediol dehydrogenase/(S,S)-butanediol dehydrogenase/diacetyl reductase
MGRVTGRGIIITGGGSGIGEGFAKAFAKDGAKVGVFDLSQTNADRVVKEITDAGGQAIALVGNVTDRAKVKSLFSEFVKWAGKLDVLFNNAGFNKAMPFMDVTEENWQSIMNVNGWGVLMCSQEAAKLMIPNKYGKIINTASIAGRQGFPNFTPYCASKFAVNAITQATAKELAQYNITCNSFAPGVVDTPLWKPLNQDLFDMGAAQAPDSAINEFSVGILKGRPAQPEDLVGMAMFLASAESDYFTGQTIMIDGGMVLV